jgi:hypothetical protein
LHVAVAPRASLAVSANPALTGAVITLDTSGSVDDNGSIARVEWDLDGNGTFERETGSARQTSISYADPGTHGIAVRVIDDSGIAATAGSVIDVRRAPPRGELGASVNDGDIATNDPHVMLSVVWPAFAAGALVSNDGGFGRAGSTQTFPVVERLPWTLRSSGPERLPKTVYVRFQGGTSGRETYTDDIILDERPPSISAATLAGSGNAVAAAARKKTYKVIVRASDSHSGVSVVVFSTRKSNKAATSVRLKDRRHLGAKRLDKKVSVRASAAPRYVRVLDAAGNASPWRRLGRQRR